ncbi:CBS domain-containing protein CBSX5 isoform X2 [Helianthus annuus]|uniref:CBS domain-containing protein CBSX5 isoform X2 n=1 Tax=Helianthus annuus TaxID=4232 RepID=UPI001652C678|nr:CBS domain-containing protein CBSX5 isoform X2 [Helianthus annuus]
MANRLLAHEVSDLCLGKPPLSSIPISATIRHALAALKSSDDTHISVWSCDLDHHSTTHDHCHCVGKICMVDIICYLCKEDNISSPSLALKAPVSVLLSPIPGVVKHVDPSYSLLEAIDLIINGAQNLVVPIKNTTSKRKQLRQPTSLAPTTHAGGREFCWLTQEDVIRFLLSSIGLFSPTAAYSIESLGIIDTKILTINYHSPASKALAAISTSLSDQTSVAVIDDDGVLIGEISPFTLAYCDEMVAAAITTLSAGDLMAYIDCGGPPEDITKVVHARSGRYNRSDKFIMRRAEAIVCQPRSSLVAVMIQAIALRVSYVWVIEEDCTVVGIVKFSGMLKVFQEHLESLID